jgi:UPF0755 protein
VKKALLAAPLLAAAGFLAWWFFVPGDKVEVTLPAGVTASRAGALLAKEGVVFSARLFRVAARYAGTDRKLRPGTYTLRRHMPLPQLLHELGSGTESLGIKVPIPEGYATWQIAERLQASGVCPAEEFLRYVRGGNPEKRSYEGYLFPTTYFFEPRTPAEKVVAKMFTEFQVRVAPEYQKTEPKPNLNLHQAMTLASIVEREAVLSQERPTIAAVYLNRMRLRMRLQADPTVQYALGFWKKGLTRDDLGNPSPYNTYVHYGLPPGPICSFGLESFRAALRPATTEAIYFVADNTGGHIFTSTIEDHMKAKASFKRGLRAIKARLKKEEEEKRRAEEAGKAGSSAD